MNINRFFTQLIDFYTNWNIYWDISTETKY